MPKPSLDKLLVQKKQLEARIHLIKSREKVKERKLDTRRKILIGAAVEYCIKSGNFSQDQLTAILSKGLISTRDRELFNLTARKSK